MHIRVSQIDKARINICSEMVVRGLKLNTVATDLGQVSRTPANRCVKSRPGRASSGS